MTTPTTPSQINDALAAVFARQAAASKTVLIGRKRYRRFITPTMTVKDDGTCRCFSCGQIDEPEYHDTALCPAFIGVDQ